MTRSGHLGPNHSFFAASKLTNWPSIPLFTLNLPLDSRKFRSLKELCIRGRWSDSTFPTTHRFSRLRHFVVIASEVEPREHPCPTYTTALTLKSRASNCSRVIPRATRLIFRTFKSYTQSSAHIFRQLSGGLDGWIPFGKKSPAQETTLLVFRSASPCSISIIFSASSG